MNELFPTEESLSPKLKWLIQHGLETEHLAFGGIECPETGENVPHWVCRVSKRSYCGEYQLSSPLWYSGEIGSGDTEEEAICDFCHNSGIAHYNAGLR